MHQKINPLWEALEKGRKTYQDALTSYSEDKIKFKMDASQWNTLQVCNHLYLSEQMTLNFMRDFDFNRKNEKVGLQSSLKVLTLKLAFLLPKKFKAPAAVRKKMEESHVDNASELEQKWLLQRLSFQDYLRNFPESQMDKFIFLHPRIGKLNISQTLEFLIEHQKHHLKQMKELASHQNFPVN